MALTRRDFGRRVLAGIATNNPAPLAEVTGDASSGYLATILVTLV